MRDRRESGLKAAQARAAESVSQGGSDRRVSGGLAVAAVAVLALVSGCTVINCLLDPVEPSTPPIESATTDSRFHHTLFIADLHDTRASLKLDWSDNAKDRDAALMPAY